MQAVEQKRKADDISAVLYPNDATDYGKELRLKQQYFFVSASLQVSTRRSLSADDAASPDTRTAVLTTCTDQLFCLCTYIQHPCAVPQMLEPAHLF